MPDESSTFGLNRKKLAKLWKMGKGLPPEQADVDEGQRKAELLQHQLAESLPLETGMQHLLPEIITAICKKLKPFTGCSFKCLLLDPETDPMVLRAIKDLHKQRAESATSELEQEVSATIYYVAIASALVHHDIRITKFSYKDLRQSFAELRENNWLLSDLRNLFSRADDECIKHLNEQEIG